ncbi:hypothetical protein WDW37_10435 [Bdellovibrionota bacterium FG-1]
MVANTEVKSGEGGVGAQAGFSVEIGKVPLSEGGSMPAQISVSTGWAGPKVIGSGAVDFGKASPQGDGSLALAGHLGLNASGQVVRLDFMPGLTGATHGVSTTVSWRLPVLGGFIADRQTGTALLATGLKAETLFPLGKSIMVNAALEGDFLWGSEDAGGVYLNPSLGVAVKVGEHVSIKAVGAADILQYTSTSTAKDGSRTEEGTERIGITGTLVAQGAF